MGDAPGDDTSVRIVLSVQKTRRDLQLSVVLTIVGAVLYALFVISRSSYEAGGTSLILAWVLGSVGSVFLFVGLIFVGVNWWLLRKRRPEGS